METRALAAEGAGVVTDATLVQLSTIVVKYLAIVASLDDGTKRPEPIALKRAAGCGPSCHMRLLG